MSAYRHDCHLHTRFSPDSQVDPEAVIDAAKRAKLDDIIFTDHYECNGAEFVPPGAMDWPTMDIGAYTRTLEQIKSHSDFDFGIGVEMGQATQRPEVAEKLLAAYDWDFVIGSLHNIRNEYDFYFMDFTGRDIDALVKAYFEELYDLVKMNNFSVLGHIYYPFRYIRKSGIPFDITKYDAEVAQIFRLLIENGKGIEVNVKGTDGPQPDLRCLRLYRSLGGEIITVGSDNHTGQPGLDTEAAYSLLREAGFRAVARFRGKKPELREI